MTAEHFVQLLNALRERKPFQQYTVGLKFEVDHPRAMVVRDGVAVYLRPGGVPVWFDHDGVTSIAGDIADTSA